MLFIQLTFAIFCGLWIFCNLDKFLSASWFLIKWFVLIIAGLSACGFIYQTFLKDGGEAVNAGIFFFVIFGFLAIMSILAKHMESKE
jgi:hypothetical protein